MNKVFYILCLIVFFIPTMAQEILNSTRSHGVIDKLMFYLKFIIAEQDLNLKDYMQFLKEANVLKPSV